MTASSTEPSREEDRTTRDEANDLSPPASPFPVVGVGAPAGGFEAFTQLLQNLPSDCGMALVLIQHLDPHHASSLTDLLAKTSNMPVQEAKDLMPVRINNVYVIPPNTNIIIHDGILKLSPRTESRGQHMPIDRFLTSLAEVRDSQAIGVVLSGNGADGTLGLKAIKAEGGITFAQDASAKYDSMPRSAISAGCIDFVLPPEQIAGELVRIGKHPYVNHSQTAIAEKPPETHDDSLQALFVLLRRDTGVDFAHYKRGTLTRRVQRRMVLHHYERLEDYVQFLNANPPALQALYQDILIHVTNFFRDPATFEALQSLVIPKLLANRSPDADSTVGAGMFDR